MGYPAFAWQPRFHDHIIRDDDECLRIAAYIEGNPAKWADDAFFVTHKTTTLAGGR